MFSLALSIAELYHLVNGETALEKCYTFSLIHLVHKMLKQMHYPMFLHGYSCSGRALTPLAFLLNPRENRHPQRCTYQMSLRCKGLFCAHSAEAITLEQTNCSTFGFILDTNSLKCLPSPSCHILLHLWQTDRSGGAPKCELVGLNPDLALQMNRFLLTCQKMN